MDASNVNRLAWVLCVSLGAGAVQTGAVPAAKLSQAPIVVDAQSGDFDLAHNNVVLHKVRITQGGMSISADLGQGVQSKSGPDFDSGQWNFRGNVKITVNQGQLNSDDAQINFARQLLAKAVVNGKPAAFEQRLPKTGKLAQGRAETIDYDAGHNVVQLSKNAWLSDGSTEIRGESLKYNIGQSIVADAAEQSSQRVHIVITPPPSRP